MEGIPQSNWYYANKFARIAIEVYEEVMGKNGLNAILNLETGVKMACGPARPPAQT